MSVPIGGGGSGSGSSLSVNIKPDPPLPVEGCHFWGDGDVSVRIQRRNSMFDHARASYIHPSVAEQLSRTYLDGQPRLSDTGQYSEPGGSHGARIEVTYSFL